ncbi:sigma-70 family RNA polymerase sigma factor [Duganella sp. sic0402]|uniref:sigma-70 family RNA polymerase sigma factor n=1 Tax=Duganella sp. sic0402 TaxID=2854786 RepID=UPI001C45AB35|nr:sigma-70 family RNA polymerase sigma factor [Duganella sp. sic0402]MBV7535483.1 sigma-70 family RNA polymerase sigma factor [Duganella sp. sic0402]
MSASDPWRQLAQERPFLLRLARLQLASAADAEDAVQETLLGAIKAWASYEGRAGLRSWLTAILRHKIVDAIRARRFTAPAADALAAEDEREFDQLFTSDDAWHPEVFVDTVCGETKAAEKQLLDIIEICMNRLPEETSRLFLMREYLGMELKEIEESCTISAGNLRVTLYRARMRLRECAVRGWGELE